MSSWRERLLVLAVLCPLAGLHAGVASAETSLFIDDEPLDLEFRIDLKALCRSADKAKCRDVPARLIDRKHGDGSQAISLLVRTRGEFRLDDSNCAYPPLFLRFDENTKDTIFEGQVVLPMTPQCRTAGGRYRDWVLREYLAYRIYQLLTDKSVRTRLARITWATPSGDDASGPYWAFFAEHFRSMAARNHAELLDVEEIDLEATDPMEMATLDLFQFMIGNTDWSALELHNVIAIRDLAAAGNSFITAVPFDFDFSGLVYAKYAGPPPELPIRSTRQRLYRGFCHPAFDWAVLFERFQIIRPRAFELAETLPGQSRAGKRGTRKFLQGFYKVLDDPRQREVEIIGKCRARPTVIDLNRNATARFRSSPRSPVPELPWAWPRSAVSGRETLRDRSSHPTPHAPVHAGRGW